MRLCALNFVIFLIQYKQSMSAHCFCDPDDPDTDFNIYRVIAKHVTCMAISSVQDISIPSYCESHFNVITELTISHSNISTLPSQAFQKFQHLHLFRRMYLNALNLKLIQSKAFEGLTHLEELHLDNNELTELREDAFSNLLRLKVLDLSRNKIFNIEKRTFYEVGNAMFLHLEHNRINTFDVELADHYNNYTNDYVRSVYLSGNPLKKVPDINVRNLDLSNTTLSAFNVNMGNHTPRRLNLSINLLSTFNCSLVHRNMEDLDLSNNIIVSLNNCELNLLKLNLSNNRIKVLNGTFEVRSEFDFSHNEISTIDKNIFSKSHQLNILNMAFNKIEKIPSGLFKKLKTLTFLDLSWNKIESFQYGTFDDMISLEILNISNNHLLDLNTVIFGSLPKLKELYFDNNAISSFDVNYVSNHFDNLRLISLDHNSLDCESLADLTHLFEKDGKEVKRGDSFDVENHHGIACASRWSHPNRTGYNFKSLHDYVQKTIDDAVLHSKINEFFNESFRRTFFQRLNITNVKTARNNIFVVLTYVQTMICCLLLLLFILFYVFLKKFISVRSKVTASQLELVIHSKET